MRRGFLQENADLLNLGSRLFDLLTIVGACISSYYLAFKDWASPHAYAPELFLATFYYAVFFSSYAVHKSWRGIPVRSELKTISAAWASLVVAVLATHGLFPEIGSIDPLWASYWFVLGMFGFATMRVTQRSTLKWFRERGYNQRKIIIVGAGPLCNRVLEQLEESPWVGLTVLGCFDDSEQAAANLSVPYLGTLGEAARFVEQKRVDQVWLTVPLREEHKLRKVLHDLRHSTADIRFVPDIFGFRLLNHSISEVAGVPIVNLTSSPMTGTNRIIKAMEDKVLALAILILISPLMLLIAMGVKLGSPGPVLFTQLRHGWDGRPIRVYKFRTMKVHAETQGVVTQAKKGDPRITPFGAFLRRTSLDELPQFINVLQGRMSIVGPRPHAIEHNEFYKDQVERYMLRHKVKPGITGWAQINGYRGETDTLDKMKMRVEYDLQYIENWSLAFDLRIIFLTVFRGFVGRNAY